MMRLRLLVDVMVTPETIARLSECLMEQPVTDVVVRDRDDALVLAGRFMGAKEAYDGSEAG